MSDGERRNLPVPDMLAEVREKIRELETEEAELRQMIFADPDTRTGANWVAEVKTTKQDRCDLKELRTAHPAIVDEFTYQIEITRIVLSAITEDGEIVPARRYAKQTKAA